MLRNPIASTSSVWEAGEAGAAAHAHGPLGCRAHEECETLRQDRPCRGLVVRADARRHRDAADVAIAGHEQARRHPVVVEGRIERIVIRVRLYGRAEHERSTRDLQNTRELGESGGDAIPLQRPRAEPPLPSVGRERQPDREVSGVRLRDAKRQSGIGTPAGQCLTERQPIGRDSASHGASAAVVIPVAHRHEERATVRITRCEARADAPAMRAGLIAPSVLVHIHGALCRSGDEQRYAGLLRDAPTQPRGRVGHSHGPAIQEQLALTARRLGDQVDHAAERLSAIERRRGALDQLHALEIDG
jgi:hypothetical protein